MSYKGTGDLLRELNNMTPAARHASLGDLLSDIITQHNNLVAALTSATYMVNSAGLAIKAGGSAIVKAVNVFVALVGNVAVGKAANTDMAALVGTVADTKSALFPFYIDASNVLTTGAKTADAANANAALLLLPAVPAGLCQIGYIIVTNASGAPFVGGTTALDATGITVTYSNSLNPAPLSSSLTLATLAARS